MQEFSCRGIVEPSPDQGRLSVGEQGQGIHVFIVLPTVDHLPRIDIDQQDVPSGAAGQEPASVGREGGRVDAVARVRQWVKVSLASRKTAR